MECIGDGWHKVGDAKVLVKNRVIVECLMQNETGNWTTHDIIRWNSQTKQFQRTGYVTLAAFRSGIRRGTIAVG